MACLCSVMSGASAERLEVWGVVLKLSEGLIKPGKSISTLTHSHDWQVGFFLHEFHTWTFPQDSKCFLIAYTGFSLARVILEKTERAWKLHALSPSLFYPSLLWDFSWVIFFYKKKTGDLVKISFSGFGEPLEQINQTRGRGHGNLWFIAVGQKHG